MKLLLRPKPGLVLTMIICVSIVVFRYEAISAVVMAEMVFHKQPIYFGISQGLSTYSVHNDREAARERLIKNARLIERDTTNGIDLYQLGSTNLWMPSGNLFYIAGEKAEQDQRIYERGQAKVVSGDVVLDIGANIGLYARHALALGASKVIAVEPVPMHLECLRRNLKAEIESGRVVVYPKGVWNRDDILEISMDSNTAADSFVIPRNGRLLRLPLTTIDKLVSELHLAKVNFIKMDIEGSERRAIAGAAETIRKFRPFMAICTYHLPDDPLAIPATIKALRPDYSQECGSCIFFEGRIRPEVYFYY